MSGKATTPEGRGAPTGWRLIFEGAEARLYRGWWLGREALYKVRVAKGYRHPGLDRRLRVQRTRAEARLLVAAGEAGVRVPGLLQVRPGRSLLVQEWVEGLTWKTVIEKAPPAGEASELAHEIGTQVARTHRAGLAHGDLTTSNLLAGKQGPVVVDWGLGRLEASLEQQGLDLQVLWECVGASHPLSAKALLEGFAAGYREAWSGAEEVLGRRETIEARGRYR